MMHDEVAGRARRCAARDADAAGWRFWIDRGGTFTDVVAQAPDGSLRTHKLLSEDPERYEDAAVEGVRRVLGLRGGRDGDRDGGEPIPDTLVAEVRMGTTVATNALLEREGTPTLYVTTRGFGDALRIGYQDRPDIFALDIRLPAPAYARVLEVDERVGADGQVVRALDEEGGAARARRGPPRRPGRLRHRLRARLRPPGARAARGGAGARRRLLPGLRLARHEPADEAGRARRDHRRRRLPLPHPAALRRRRGGPAGRRATAVHAVARRPHRRGAVPRQGRGPLGSRGRCGRRGRGEPARGVRQGHRVRHGRHVDRREPLRGRAGAQLRERGRRRAAALADAARAHGGGRRRVDLRVRGREIPGRAAQRRRRPRTGVLRQGRAAHGDRLQPGGRASCGRRSSRTCSERTAPERSTWRRRGGRSRPWPRACATPASSRRRPNSSPTTSSAWPASPWPAPSNGSPRSAGTTSPATCSAASAARPASTPAWSPTRSA